jgi:hypothetical protein
MMLPSLLSVLGAALLTAVQSGPTHTWIADVKANRDALAGQDIRLEGEVVDVRSTSPTARRGFYRLTDASDPTGVLVRTERIPIDGGSFRLRAKIARDQIVNGTLLLDEAERDRVDARPFLPVVAALASGLIFVILLVLARRAVAEERQYAVSPPLWLLPDSGPYGKPGAGDAAPVQPALKYEPELEEADRYQRAQLKRRKRSLLQALVGSLVFAASSAAWVIGTRPAQGQVPAFIFIDSNDPESRASRNLITSADTALTAAAATIPLDSIDVALLPRPVAPARPGPTARALPPAETRTLGPGIRLVRPDSAAATRDTARTEVVPPAPPPPVPSPAPPPPPPPPEPVTPVRDPAVDRARAQSLIQDAAARLVAAINARRSSDVAMLVPEALAGNLERRDRFLKLIKDFGPRASIAGVDEATMGEDRGEASIAIAFSWRGDFGVDRKKSGRLVAFVRRDGETWRFEGARLVDAIP